MGIICKLGPDSRWALYQGSALIKDSLSVSQVVDAVHQWASDDQAASDSLDLVLMQMLQVTAFQELHHAKPPLAALAYSVLKYGLGV